MKAILIRAGIRIAAVVLFLTSIARPVYAGNAPESPDAKNDLAAAAAYCVTQGGEVENRAPYFNTNDDPKNWFRLSGYRKFCQFTLKTDGSRTHVLLTTLFTQQPSLAALAYYAKVPFDGNCNGNPGSCYCSQLGGTDLFGGINGLPSGQYHPRQESGEGTALSQSVCSQAIVSCSRGGVSLN